MCVLGIRTQVLIFAYKARLPISSLSSPMSSILSLLLPWSSPEQELGTHNHLCRSLKSVSRTGSSQMSLTPNCHRDRERCVWEAYLFHNLETWLTVSRVFSVGCPHSTKDTAGHIRVLTPGHHLSFPHHSQADTGRRQYWKKQRDSNKEKKPYRHF